MAPPFLPPIRFPILVCVTLQERKREEEKNERRYSVKKQGRGLALAVGGGIAKE